MFSKKCFDAAFDLAIDVSALTKMLSLLALLSNPKEELHVNLDHPQHRHRDQRHAAHGRSMEEEVRTILRSVLSQPAAAKGLGSRLSARFAAIGGVDLPQPERTEPARAADFGNTASGAGL